MQPPTPVFPSPDMQNATTGFDHGAHGAGSQHTPNSKGYQRVAIIGKHQEGLSLAQRDHSRVLVHAVAALVLASGRDVLVESETALGLGIEGFTHLPLAQMQGKVDVAIVMGGDGTMLGAARLLAVMGIALIGINQGRLGFITDVAQNQFREVLPDMLAGEVEHDIRPLMQACVLRGEGKSGAQEVFSTLAMNDVVVNRGSAGSMVELRVEVDGHFVANHRADGLIIASPTGSTAYALAAGGPIMVPTLSGWTLVPIAPHTLSNRPLVLADPSQVVIEVVAGKMPHANFDMQSFSDLQLGDKIVVSRSAHSAHFLHPKGWNYFAMLRAKLHWNEGASL